MRLPYSHRILLTYAGSCCRSAFGFLLSLFPGPGMEKSQQLSPDPFSSRGRDARGRFAKGRSGNPARAASRYSQSQAPCARSRGQAERAGVVESARPQASFVAAARGATIAAACCHRPGEASRDRPGVVADGRGLPADAGRRSGSPCARWNRARRGRAHRTASACGIARRHTPCTILVF
jgi:hypothetical protein